MGNMKQVVKKTFAFLLSVALVLTLLPAASAQAAAKPKLSKASASVVVGGTATIKVKNAPAGAKLTYKSNKTAVATVTKKGKVTGLKAGSAKVTVTVKKGKKKVATLTYKVTVKKPSISAKTLSVQEGSTAVLTVKNLPKKNSVTWSSSDETVATVAGGTVTGVKAGTATITAKVTQKKSGKVAKKVYTLTSEVTVSAGASNGSEVKAATQEEVTAALASTGLTKLTIETQNATAFTIAGDHKNVTLVVNAPNASIDNSATWKSVEIQAIKDNTWVERAIDNIFKILARKARLVAAAGSRIAEISIESTGTKGAGDSVKIETEGGGQIATVSVKSASTTVQVKASGTGGVAQINISAPQSDVAVSGDSQEATKVNIEANAKDTNLTAEKKVEVQAEADAKINLENGAAGSSVDASKSGTTVQVQNTTGSDVAVKDSTGNTTNVATGNTATAAATGTTTAPVSSNTGTNGGSSNNNGTNNGGSNNGTNNGGSNNGVTTGDSGPSGTNNNNSSNTDNNNSSNTDNNTTDSAPYTYTFVVKNSSEYTTGRALTVNDVSVSLQKNSNATYVKVGTKAYAVKAEGQSIDGTITVESNGTTDTIEGSSVAINNTNIELLFNSAQTKYGDATYKLTTNTKISDLGTSTPTEDEIIKILQGLGVIDTTEQTL